MKRLLIPLSFVLTLALLVWIASTCWAGVAARVEAAAPALAPTSTPIVLPTNTVGSEWERPASPGSSSQLAPQTPVPAPALLPIGSAPTRIQFPRGATSTAVAGRLNRGVPARYVLRALAGQVMEMSAISPGPGLMFAVTGADGVYLKKFGDGSGTWRGTLPATQDYFIDLISPESDTTYRLTVGVSALKPTPTPQPVRIRFQPGTTSATVSGHLAPWQTDRYVLRAFARQTMDVLIWAPGSYICLTITGADGTPLKRCADEQREWRGVLPATQDYFVQAIAAGSPVDYQLIVAISPFDPAQPQRIQFEPEATSAAVEGVLAPGASRRYVLRALRGQSLDLHISSTGAIAKSVEGQDGSYWSWPFVENHGRIPYLPATQDYFITLTAVDQVAPTRYTMAVIIPPR